MQAGAIGDPALTRAGALKQGVLVYAVLAAFVGLAEWTGVVWFGAAGVVAACGTIWPFLRSGGTGWDSIGLARPTRLARVAGWVVLGTVGIAVVAGVLQSILTSLLGPRDLGDFAGIRGNGLALAATLVVSWSSAAFGEEILFRGFLLQRLEIGLGAGRGTKIAALVVQAALFGLVHLYQGPSGVILVFAIGFMMGLLFILSGRTLWVPILVHGIIDTISLVAIFFGLGPDGQAGGQ